MQVKVRSDQTTVPLVQRGGLLSVACTQDCRVLLIIDPSEQGLARSVQRAAAVEQDVAGRSRLRLVAGDEGPRAPWGGKDYWMGADEGRWGRMGEAWTGLTEDLGTAVESGGAQLNPQAPYLLRQRCRDAAFAEGYCISCVSAPASARLDRGEYRLGGE